MWISFRCKLRGEVDQFRVQINSGINEELSTVSSLALAGEAVNTNVASSLNEVNSSIFNLVKSLEALRV